MYCCLSETGFKDEWTKIKRIALKWILCTQDNLKITKNGQWFSPGHAHHEQHPSALKVFVEITQHKVIQCGTKRRHWDGWVLLHIRKKNELHFQSMNGENEQNKDTMHFNVAAKHQNDQKFHFWKSVASHQQNTDDFVIRSYILENHRGPMNDAILNSYTNLSNPRSMQQIIRTFQV